MKLEAPIGMMKGRRRPLRLGNVQLTIEQLLILTWRVAERDLRRTLPDGIRPWTRGDDAFVSALLFRNRSLRPAKIGFPRLSCTQLNLRSYIVDPISGRLGSIFFHRFSPSLAWLGWVARRLFRFSCDTLSFDIETSRDESGRLRWHARSPDEHLVVRALETSRRQAIDDDLLDVLTNPHTAYVADEGRSTLTTWDIWHLNQRIRFMDVETCTIEPVEGLELGLDQPDWAFFVDAVDYEVYFPARRVKSFAGSTKPNPRDATPTGAEGKR